MVLQRYALFFHRDDDEAAGLGYTGVFKQGHLVLSKESGKLTSFYDDALVGTSCSTLAMNREVYYPVRSINKLNINK